MLPVLHAMSKTSIELRRAINRLKVFKDQNPTDEHVVDGSVDLLVEDLEQARRHIPGSLRDIDLTT
jgi:hypothetical protein